jgi:UDP-N-acetylglucosamine acyltransferase
MVLRKTYKAFYPRHSAFFFGRCSLVMDFVHASGIIGATAEIGEGVSVGAYAVIEDGAVIGNNCVISSHAIIRSGAILAEGVKVDSFAVIGGNPQDLRFDVATPSGVRIGKNTVIREGVTVHRATQRDHFTTVGESCYLMAQSHVAHDCVVGNNVILVNGALLAGFVEVGDYAFFGGGAAVHQFVVIGESVMIAGHASITRHIPHFLMVAERDSVSGLNLIGLRRRGLNSEEIRDIKSCYQAVYLANDRSLNVVQKAADASSLAKTGKGRQFLSFFAQNPHNRNFVQPSRHFGLD